MDCCKFEAKIQFECVLEIVKIVRSGDLLAGKSELLQHAGCILGCLGKYMEAEPVVYGSSFDLPSTLEECSQEIEQSLTVIQAASLSPAMIALILRLVEMILAKFAKG